MRIELYNKPQSHLTAGSWARNFFDQLVNDKAWPGDSVTSDDKVIALAKVLAVLGALLVLRDDVEVGANCQALAVRLSEELFTADRIETALFDNQPWVGHVFVSTRVPRHGMASHTKWLSSNSPGDSHGCILFQPEAGDARASRLQFGAPLLHPIAKTWSAFFARHRLTEYGLVVANISRPPPGERCRFYTTFSMRSHRLWIARECQQSVAQLVVEWQNTAYSIHQHCWNFVDAICKTIGCSRMRDAFVRRSDGFRRGIERLVSDHTKHVAPSTSAPTGVWGAGTPSVLWAVFDTHRNVDAAHDRFRETLFACRWNDSDLSPQYLADMDEFVACALGIHVAHQLRGEECTLLDKRSDTIAITTPL